MKLNASTNAKEIQVKGDRLRAANRKVKDHQKEVKFKKAKKLLKYEYTPKLTLILVNVVSGFSRKDGEKALLGFVNLLKAIVLNSQINRV